MKGGDRQKTLIVTFIGMQPTDKQGGGEIYIQKANANEYAQMEHLLSN